MNDEFSFAVHATDGEARLGEVSMPRGVIRTPAFMPVGTAATVKAMYPNAVRALGYDIVLSNTYHLMLAPGAERIAALGGLHKFMNWPHPILTDSGGFQVMSLAKLRKLSERGVTFQSHIDGSRHELTPERSMEVQRLLGSDIQMQLDECVRLPCSYEEVERAMRLSLRWAERSKSAFGEQPGRAVFGIVQGGTEKDLRVFSAEGLAEMDFHGYAIGGLAVGEPQAAMLEMIDVVVPHLPFDKPRYLMGVGTPDDLLQSIEARRRHVRLRDADPRGKAWARLYPPGPSQPAQRALRRRFPPDRSAIVVSDGARLFPRLLAPSDEVGRDPCDDGPDRNQPCLLSRSDVWRPACDQGRAPRRLYRRDATKLGRRRGGETLRPRAGN